ncbi:MAG: hypothetical protein NW203_02010 [Hyphomonadaceae bacterium]|nr:hypothetical protein [Hyphomonadaceae bacterium]
MLKPLILALAMSALPAGAAAVEAGDARATYVERRGLLAADAACALLTPDIRAALTASALQSRGALVRAGWTAQRLDVLEAAAVAAAQARSCADPRTRAAADQARAAFAGWARLPAMTFPGAARGWIARREPAPGGWRLAQAADAATFGVRVGPRWDQDAVTLLAPAPHDAPAAARVLVRDPERADAGFLDAPGRLAQGLAAGAPPPQARLSFFASARALEGRGAARQAVFTFPREALAAIARLDPREAAVIEIGDGPNAQRVLIEAGDLRAAIAFLDAGR